MRGEAWALSIRTGTWRKSFSTASRRIEQMMSPTSAYFNPADLEYPVGLNPLQKTPRDRHHLVVDSIISTLKSIWGDVWGTGRMQYVMHHTLSALLFYDHATFLGVNRLLSDLQFRKKVLLRVKDPIFYQEYLSTPTEG
jgi:hypothetical protein